MTYRLNLVTALLVGFPLLAAVPTVSAGPALPPCPDAFDDDTCSTWEHHRYCLAQKPPYVGDPWRCFANPDPW